MILRHYSTLCFAFIAAFAALGTPTLMSSAHADDPPLAPMLAQPPYTLGPDSLPQPGIPQGEMLSLPLTHSTIYPGTERTVWVYVPAQYHPEKPACLCVGLDGPGFEVQHVFDNLIAQGKMPTTLHDTGGTPKTFVEHASKLTLVLSQVADNWGVGDAYRVGGSGGGTLFLDDVCGPHFTFQNQKVWARQLNPEGSGTHVTVDGATLWVLGMKAEAGGTILQTLHGGHAEILGGLSQTNNGKMAPMFLATDSDLSVTFAEVNNSNDPFVQFVVETRAAQQKAWGDPNAQFKGFRPIFFEGRSARTH